MEYDTRKLDNSLVLIYDAYIALGGDDMKIKMQNLTADEIELKLQVDAIDRWEVTTGMPALDSLMAVHPNLSHGWYNMSDPERFAFLMMVVSSGLWSSK